VKTGVLWKMEATGVADGIRTHNNWNHKGEIDNNKLIKSDSYEQEERLKTPKKST